jgi:hypothetical protein
MLKSTTSNFGTPENGKPHNSAVAKLIAAFLSLFLSMELITSFNLIDAQICSLLAKAGLESNRTGPPVQPAEASAESQFAEAARRCVGVRTSDTYSPLRNGLRLSSSSVEPQLLSVVIVAAAAASRGSSPQYRRTERSTQEACSDHQSTHPKNTFDPMSLSLFFALPRITGIRTSGRFQILQLGCIVLIPVTEAAPISGSTTDDSIDWRHRALNSLTYALSSCAFLLPPLLVVALGGVATNFLLRKRAEGWLAGLMLFSGTIFASIEVPPGHGNTGSAKAIRTGVGLVHAFFMLGYCKRIILRNNLSKGKSVLATVPGLMFALVVIVLVMAVPAIGRAWRALIDLEPACITPSMIAFGFFLCDLFIEVTQTDMRNLEAQVFEMNSHRNQFDLEHALGRGPTTSQAQYRPVFERRAGGSLTSQFPYDNDHEELSSQVDVQTISRERPIISLNLLNRFWGRRRGRYD